MTTFAIFAIKRYNINKEFIMPNKPAEKLLTIEEVAKILRVSTRSVNRYIESGKLKASKIGVWRIKESDLNSFLEDTSNIKPKKKK
jgi:excisionase family DNA binding protein